MFTVTENLTYRTATIMAVSLWNQLQAVKDTKFGPVEAQKISDCAANAHAALCLVSIEADDAKRFVITTVRNILWDKNPEAESQSTRTLATMGVATESLSSMSLDAMVEKMETDCSDEEWQRNGTIGLENPKREAILWHAQLKELLERQPTL